jgi:predicted GIY-YIG superfamily endonuclease
VNESAVYRAFAANGRLLYVGVSEQLQNRTQQHKYTKPWWGEVASITATFYPGERLAAYAAERAAIKAEQPLYNSHPLGGPKRWCRVCGGSFKKGDTTSVTHAKCSSRT